MSKASEQQADGRREPKERRKKKFLPYLKKDRRNAKIIREADVMEIYIPPLKAETDRRNEKVRRSNPR